MAMSAKTIKQPKHIKMLPIDIIVDLLSWVPAKTIGRFRCTSKSWRSLLSQPKFIKTHLNRSKHLPRDEESLILVSHDSQSLYSVQFKNTHHFNEMTVYATKLTFDSHRFSSFSFPLATCDGLILYRGEQKVLLLINPTTREIKELPSSPYALDLLTCGLGYDAVNDDYKVVTISQNEIDDQMFVDVYSVRNGTWKRVENSPFDHTEFKYTSTAFVDEYIHWVANRPSDDSYVIAAFDLGEEKFYEVPLPDLEDREKSTDDSDLDSEESGDSWEFVFDNLVALGGRLCAYPEGISDSCHQLFVGMMKEYGVEESWTKILFNDDSDSVFRPICLLGKEQMVVVMNEGNTDEKLVMYNLEEGTFKDIVVLGIPGKFSVGQSFMESLVSPHCSNEAV